MLKGLRDIHATGYVHSDIKPQNLMVVEEIIELKDLKEIKRKCNKGHQLNIEHLTLENDKKFN